MVFREQNIKGVLEIQLEPKGDERGYFMRTYDRELFAKHGLGGEWIQESESFSKEKGTVRGLHFQFPPYAETKVVRAGSGEIFFAFVDLRKGSSTFGKWGSVTLSAAKKNVIVIPPGVANGMCTLTADCTLLYKIDVPYLAESQGSIKWNDPDLGIAWPVKAPASISEKDKNSQSFKEFVAKYGGLVV